MIQIIKERGYETITEYHLDIFNENGEVCLSFPTDGNGNVIITPENKENYKYSINNCNTGAFTKHLSRSNHRYRTNAVAICHCGEQIELYDEYMGACECPNCGQWYNLFGQELNDPCEWELKPENDW